MADIQTFWRIDREYVAYGGKQWQMVETGFVTQAEAVAARNDQKRYPAYYVGKYRVVKVTEEVVE